VDPRQYHGSATGPAEWGADRHPGVRPIRYPKGASVTAIIAAVLFGLALLFQLLNLSVSVITANVLITAGLLCVALHLAGVGSAVRVRGYTRRR
jgi:hypothetical protein